jgi:hypothetical protein
MRSDEAALLPVRMSIRSSVRPARSTTCLRKLSTRVSSQTAWSVERVRDPSKGPSIYVFLNGQQKTDFVNTDVNRGQPTADFRFVGLQTHTGHVLFRKIQIKANP